MNQIKLHSTIHDAMDKVWVTLNSTQKAILIQSHFKALTEATPNDDIPEERKSQETAHNASERTVRPYYKTQSHDGLPAGVSLVTNMHSDKTAYKVTFRSKYLGMYYDLAEAIERRREAEKEFDNN